MYVLIAFWPSFWIVLILIRKLTYRGICKGRCTSIIRWAFVLIGRLQKLGCPISAVFMKALFKSVVCNALLFREKILWIGSRYFWLLRSFSVWRFGSFECMFWLMRSIKDRWCYVAKYTQVSFYMWILSRDYCVKNLWWTYKIWRYLKYLNIFYKKWVMWRNFAIRNHKKAQIFI